MDREEAAKELMAMLEEAQEGPYYSEEEVRAHLLEILAPSQPSIYDWRHSWAI